MVISDFPAQRGKQSKKDLLNSLESDAETQIVSLLLLQFNNFHLLDFFLLFSAIFNPAWA